MSNDETIMERSELDTGINDEVAELKAKIVTLEDRNVRLVEDLRNAENEKRYAEGELFRLQKDIARIRGEMERLKTPPLIVGSLRDVLPNNRVVVKSSTGPDFVVAVSDYIEPSSLVPGSRVTLNKQTLAVMEVIPNRGPDRLRSRGRGEARRQVLGYRRTQAADAGAP